MVENSGVQVRDRLAAAAFELFEERGYERTTVDDIAQRAGVGRTTFFRSFPSKEDVIFPRHEELLRRIEERLSTATPETRLLALEEAARTVLEHYLSEADLARARYRLIVAVPALRAREQAGIRQYQRLFTATLRRWTADEPDGELRAELLAAAVVAAHNRVLRRWLRRETTEPYDEFARAMAVVGETAGGAGPAGDGGTSIVVLRTPQAVDAVLPRLRRALLEAGDEPS